MLSFPQLRGNFRHGDCRVIAGNAVLGDQFMASGKITKRSVDALISSGQHDILWDDSIKGFGAKRTKAGAVSYVLQFRMGGRESKTRRYTIGSHGSPWTPATARAEAERLAILIAQGIDLGEAERQRRRESVDLAFDNYSDRFAEACVGEGCRTGRGPGCSYGRRFRRSTMAERRTPGRVGKLSPPFRYRLPCFEDGQGSGASLAP